MSEMAPIEFSVDDPYYAAICYAQSHGAKNLKDHPGCWERQVDETWFVAFNGHKEPTPTHGGKKSLGQSVDVLPFSVYVEYNGWPAGILTPSGGEFAAGSGANVDTFVAALAAHAVMS